MDLPPPFTFRLWETTPRWLEWLGGFQNYLQASGVTLASQKFGLLLYLGGDALQDLFEELAPSVSSQDGHDNYEVAVKAFSNYFKPTPAVEEEYLVTSYDGDDDYEVYYINYPLSRSSIEAENISEVSSHEGDDDFKIKEHERLCDGLDQDCQLEPEAAQETDNRYEGMSEHNDTERHHDGLEKDCQQEFDAAQSMLSLFAKHEREPPGNSRDEDIERQRHCLDDDCQPDRAVQDDLLPEKQDPEPPDIPDHFKVPEPEVDDIDMFERQYDSPDDRQLDAAQIPLPPRKGDDMSRNLDNVYREDEWADDSNATPKRHPDSAPDDEQSTCSVPEIITTRDPTIDPRSQTRNRA